MVSIATRARKALGSAIMEGFFNGAARLGSLHPLARPSRHGVEVVKDLRYHPGSGNDHLLDVYRPTERKGPLPIVFYVHGGAFRILSKDTHWVMALAYARRGYVVFNVNYRLAPKHRFPAAIADVCHAYAYMVENAARLGGDTSRVVVAGESAGANLATSLTLATTYERPEPFARHAFDTGIVPKAVVPSCGMFQVTDSERFSRRKAGFSPFVADRIREVERAYLGSSPSMASLDLADPLCFLERAEKPQRALPPFFLPVGTKDPLLDDTRRMARALQKLGATGEDAYYPGEVHAFHAFVMRAAAKKCWADTFAFLAKHGVGPDHERSIRRTGAHAHEHA